jgi:hypothetical protein
VSLVSDEGQWDRWAAEARVGEAAASRSREGWLRQAASEDASLVGTLVDLAERGTPVVVTMRSGRRLRAAIWRVGADCVAVQHDDRRVSWLALNAVAAIGAEPGGQAVPTGTRRVESEVTLADVLGDLVADQATVAVFLSDMTDPLRGRLVGGGRDIVRLTRSGESPDEVVIAVQVVSEVVLVDSG